MIIWVREKDKSRMILRVLVWEKKKTQGLYKESIRRKMITWN